MNKCVINDDGVYIDDHHASCAHYQVYSEYVFIIIII